MTPPKGPYCFEKCQARDGLVVCLQKKRYDEHVLEHEDLLRDFDYPVTEIMRALEQADSIRQEQPPKQTYIGPPVMPTRAAVAGFGFANKPRRMHVLVWKDSSTHGHVVTAYTVIA